MMIMYDENVDEQIVVSFVGSEMLGELRDMSWHHHWCLKKYLDSLTIIFSANINRSKKMQNHGSVMFYYSNNSRVSSEVDLCTFPFFQVFMFFQ